MIAAQRMRTLESALLRNSMVLMRADDTTHARALASTFNDGNTSVGLCEAQAVIVDTGSIVLSGARHQARSESLLVDHLVVLAQYSDLHDDLGAYFASLDGSALHDEHGSHLTFISGPSMTADIEKVLVKPAHGPAKVSLILAMR